MLEFQILPIISIDIASIVIHTSPSSNNRKTLENSSFITAPQSPALSRRPTQPPAPLFPRPVFPSSPVPAAGANPVQGAAAQPYQTRLIP